MKTLDEVIAELEDEKVFADALYYLQMYRSDMKMYADNQKYWEDELKQKIKDFGDAKDRYIKRLKELDTGTLNNPLTWDELRQMEGKPVWLEVYDPIDEKTGWHTASWKLIEFINDEYFDVRDSDGDQECYYKFESEYWQAYRKER